MDDRMDVLLHGRQEGKLRQGQSPTGGNIQASQPLVHTGCGLPNTHKHIGESVQCNQSPHVGAYAVQLA